MSCGVFFFSFADDALASAAPSVGMRKPSSRLSRKLKYKEEVESDDDDDVLDTSAVASAKPAASAPPLSLEYVERVLDMRASRLEAAAASLREIETRKREANLEVWMFVCAGVV